MTQATYTRHSVRDRDMQVVAITAVDTVERNAQGLTTSNTTIVIDCRYPVGGQYVFPAKGDQWYVERSDGVWRLSSRVPFNDDNTSIEPQEGQVVLGGTGPVELNGSQVNVHSGLLVNDNLDVGKNFSTAGDVSVTGSVAVSTDVEIDGIMTLGGVDYRSNAGVLEHNTAAPDDDPVWAPVSLIAEDVVIPYDLSYMQTSGTHAVGLGQNLMGYRIARNVTFTAVTYRCGTADASGSLAVELHINGALVGGSGATIASGSQVAGVTVTGSWAFAAGDILTVYVTAIGTTPGNGLIADLVGTVD